VEKRSISIEGLNAGVAGSDFTEGLGGLEVVCREEKISMSRVVVLG